MSTELTRRGSIPAAMAWMLGLSAVLFWMPVLGGLIAGYVGGSRAGSLGRAVLAVFLPGILLGLAAFFLGGVLGSLPLIGPIFGAIAGLGLFAKSFLHTVPLLIGAAVGGKLAENR